MSPGANFDSLPIHVQEEICSYFTTTELEKYFVPVCKNWKSLALKFVREISFNGETQSTRDVIKTLRKTRNVRVLTFTNAYANPFNWYVLSKAIPQITLKHLRKFEFISFNIRARGVKKLVARFPEIEDLKIVFKEANPCDLNTLDLYNDVIGYRNLVICQIVKWKLLKHISIDIAFTPCDIECDIADVGDDIIELISTKCINIKHIELLRLKVTRGGFNDLCTSRGNALEKLNIHVCQCYVEETPVTESLELCPNLKVLHLYREDEDCILSVNTNRLLEELYFTDCDCQYLFAVACCIFKHLRKLTFVRTEYPKNDLEVWILKSFPVLTTVEFVEVELLDCDVACIATYFRTIKRIVFESVWRITSKSVSVIAVFLPNAEYVKYKSCSDFDHEYIDFVLVQLKNSDMEVVVCPTRLPCNDQCCKRWSYDKWRFI